MYGYFFQIRPGKIVLWCYLIWYLVTVYFYFDPSLRIWLNSLGISLVIGVALILSVSGNKQGVTDRWQTMRLFMMPFCVSSFSSLIKNNGFIFVVPPRPVEQAVSVGACLAFVLAVVAIKHFQPARVD